MDLSQPEYSQETFPSHKKSNKPSREDDAARFGTESYLFTQEESMRSQRKEIEKSESLRPRPLHCQQSSFGYSELVRPRPTQAAAAPILQPATPAKSTRSEKKGDTRQTGTSPLTPASGGDTEPRPCDCGSAEEDGGMVECAQCQTWCHTICHGYKDDAGLPELFFW